jgi:hypothetical protein
VDQLLGRAQAESAELLGPDGLLSQVTSAVLEQALAEEMAGHLSYGYEKCYLQGPVPRLGVDPDDLVLGGLWLAGELLFELGVADYLGVVLQDRGDLLLLSRGEHGAGLGHAGISKKATTNTRDPRVEDRPLERLVVHRCRL